MYRVKIIADSMAPCRARLTTFELELPKFVLADLNTHRALSRCTSSARSMPTIKLIAKVWRDPVIPVAWGRNQPGMTAGGELTGWRRFAARRLWLACRVPVLGIAYLLVKLGLHKQLAGRLVEPWLFVTTVLSGTEWANFFGLRCQPNAQPELQHIAYRMREELRLSTPAALKAGEWHLPYVTDEERLAGRWGERDQRMLSVARCARTSTQSESRDPYADLRLHNKLRDAGHWSPFEHVAYAMTSPIGSGNFFGWGQYRKSFLDENLT